MSKWDYTNVCPKCGATPYRSCRTTSGTDRATDTHRARIDAQFENPRMRPIKEALQEVYGPGAMVVSCAFHMATRWDRYVLESVRYDPGDAERTEAALFHEVHNAIWMMFPGGGTAEHAANMVKKALVSEGLWAT